MSAATVDLTNGGSLIFSASGSGGTASVALTGATSKIDITGATTGVSIGSIAGVGGQILLGAKKLTVGGNNASTTFGGIISDTGGAGSIVKTGPGTWTLTGTNTYGGGTTVTGGLINFAAANNFGTGTITLNGGGLQWASGTTTDISSRLAPLGSAGGTFDTNGNDVTLASAITGTGGLTKAGLGTLTLTGANGYGGGTTVSGGVLQGMTTSLQGDIVNNAAVVFNQAVNGTYAGTMSGTGSLLINGTGTVILSGSNSYSGGTTVSAGTLQGTTTSLQGDIVNNATVAFSQAGNGTYAGTMSGTGSLLIAGTGTVTLSGSNSYGGGTTVTGGSCQLRVGGQFRHRADHAEWRRPAMGGRHHDGYLVASGAAGFGRRHVRHQRQRRDACIGHHGHRWPHQGRAGDADAHRRQRLRWRHDGVGRRAAGHDDEPAGRYRQQRRRGVQPGGQRHLRRHHVRDRQLADQRHRHGDPERQQQLQRRHDGVGRHIAGHDDEPAGRYRQQRDGGLQPDGQRCLCRQHVGHRRPAGQRHRHRHVGRQQQLQRRHGGGGWRAAGYHVEPARQHPEQRDGGLQPDE